MLLQVLVVVLALILVMVLGGGQQAGDVADAFGDALPEEQLGAQSQVLGVFDEAEANHGSLACTQLVLQQREREEVTCCSYTQDGELITCFISPAHPPSHEGTPLWPSA